MTSCNKWTACRKQCRDFAMYIHRSQACETLGKNRGARQHRGRSTRDKKRTRGHKSSALCFVCGFERQTLYKRSTAAHTVHNDVYTLRQDATGCKLYSRCLCRGPNKSQRCLLGAPTNPVCPHSPGATWGRIAQRGRVGSVDVGEYERKHRKTTLYWKLP